MLKDLDSGDGVYTFTQEDGFIKVDYVEVECPQCHDIICFESDIVDDEDIIEVTCPNCSKVVFVNDGSMPLPEGWEKGENEPQED